MYVITIARVAPSSS